MTTIPNAAKATGRRDDRDGTAYVVFERTFAAPIEDYRAELA